jgi:hypothetical protein
MAKDIEGVKFNRDGDSAICYVEFLSDEIKALIRKNLTTICHGSLNSAYSGVALYNYETTLNSFLERYKGKPEKTKKGMIGEFLSHILITELFEEFDVVTPYFNLEEKSIKKGFDLLLYKRLDNSVWITEVKSGELHKDKNHDQTALVLLKAAKDDLEERLNKQEVTYWYNAVNAVNASLSGKKDYKDALVGILLKEGSDAAQKQAKSNDNCVILVSNLFEPLDIKVSKEVIKSFQDEINEAKIFASTVVFCLQKETYLRVVDFIESEAAGA